MRLSFAGSVKVLAAVLVVAGGAAFLADHGAGELFVSAEEYSARERVRRVLLGLKTGQSKQEAVCLWSTGTLIMPDGPFDKVEDDLDAWARQEEIVPVSDYEIVGSQSESDEPHTQGTGVVLVSIRVNGRPHAVRVAPSQRLTWIHVTPGS
jgi:hypothetical protein